jgi:hypothetical protein
MSEDAEAQIALGFGSPVRGVPIHSQSGQERGEGRGAGADEEMSASHGVLLPMNSIRDREGKRDAAPAGGDTRAPILVPDEESREGRRTLSRSVLQQLAALEADSASGHF